MRVPAPVNAPLRMGDLASVITSSAWLEWFQRLSDYYDTVPKLIDPKSPYFGQSAPANPSEGLLAYADGVNWDPAGTGIAGIYNYISGAWIFSGAFTPAASVTSETAFGVLAAVGTSLLYARQDHTHGSPADPVPTHAALTSTHGASGNILGATTADAAYAPIAKGVTNGDSHDHVGGDGAQIDYNGLANLPTIPTLASGTYTPTRSAEANLDSNATMSEAQYLRVGSTVTVSGRFTADPTLAATATSFEITLPVASNIGAAEDVAGVAFCGNIAGQGAEIIGVAANDTAKVQWTSGDITSQTWSYIFTYQVV